MGKDTEQVARHKVPLYRLCPLQLSEPCLYSQSIGSAVESENCIDTPVSTQVLSAQRNEFGGGLEKLSLCPDSNLQDKFRSELNERKFPFLFPEVG